MTRGTAGSISISAFANNLANRLGLNVNNADTSNVILYKGSTSNRGIVIYQESNDRVNYALTVNGGSSKLVPSGSTSYLMYLKYSSCPVAYEKSNTAGFFSCFYDASQTTGDPLSGSINNIGWAKGEDANGDDAYIYFAKQTNYGYRFITDTGSALSFSPATNGNGINMYFSGETNNVMLAPMLVGSIKSSNILMTCRFIQTIDPKIFELNGERYISIASGGVSLMRPVLRMAS